MEALLILLALAVPISGIAGFVIALSLRQRVVALETRFGGLERALLTGHFGVPTAARPATRPAGEVPASPDRPSVRPEFAAPRAETPAPDAPKDVPPPEPAAAATSVPPAPDAPTGPSVPPAPDPAARPTAGAQSAVPPVSPPHIGAQPAAVAPRPSEPNLEERLGTRWVVWIGGVALALGAIFLVRYSIEQGLITPALRIVLGGLFAAALLAAGEWMRRREGEMGFTGLPEASIPAILTAAGTTAAYATLWAAHGLYGFIRPGPAFLLLGVVALATLAAALLHGPYLAGLGLVGAYVTPLLISSPEPNFWALYLYLVVVTGAAFALARARLWRWLAVTAVAFSAAWLLPGLLDAILHPLPHSAYVAALYALAAALIVSGLTLGPAAAPDEVDEISSAALGVYLACSALVAIAGHHEAPTLIAFAALVASTVAIAWRAPSAAGALPAAAGLAALVIAAWAVRFNWETLVLPEWPRAGTGRQPSETYVGGHLTLGAAFAALFGVAGFLAQGRSERPVVPILWAASAVIAPVAILVALYYRIAGLERSIPFAAVALLLAALYAIATEHLARRPPRPGLPSAMALFAVGAVASLALALTMALEKGWLTIALALMAAGIAYIADKRPLPLLRSLAAACAALVALRVMWEPRIVGADVGTTPIFNWLLWGYGVPALAFWIGGHFLRRRADDVPARMLDSAAILFTVLTATLQIRHYINGGDVYRSVPLLAEIGLQVSAFLAISIGLERIRGRTRSPVHDAAAVILAAVALMLAVTFLLLRLNPLWTHEAVGGLFFNLLLLAYGIPAVLAITLALVAKNTRPMPYRALAAGSAVVLSLTYLTLQVRRLFQGPVLNLHDYQRAPSDPELWTYSAVWLAFGVVLLLLGILIRSAPARLASAAVILLSVVKVFLYDLAGIGGIWRSLSFIGLGLVLVGIGWLYQRLLFPPQAHSQTLGASPAGPVSPSPST